MAVNEFRQRLMAAGASPARANKFVEERAFQMPKSETLPATSTPTASTKPASTKPRGAENWYNENYALTSEQLASSAFRAPKFGDKGFDKYFDFVFGKGSYANVQPIEIDQAPNYFTASKSTEKFDKFIVNQVRAGRSWPQIYTNIKEAVAAEDIAYPGGAETGLTEEESIDYAKSIWNEYNKYGKVTEQAYQNAIKKNKDFQYRMPDQRLKYGTMTNFDVGTVDILTNPKAAQYYAEFVKKTPDTRKQAQYKSWLASEFTRLGRTPWKDEAARRDSLKGNTAKVRG